KRRNNCGLWRLRIRAPEDVQDKANGETTLERKEHESRNPQAGILRQASFCRSVLRDCIEEPHDRKEVRRDVPGSHREHHTRGGREPGAQSLRRSKGETDRRRCPAGGPCALTAYKGLCCGPKQRTAPAGGDPGGGPERG